MTNNVNSNSRFLTTPELAQLAQYALNCYEVSADWGNASANIIDECIELFGFTPCVAQILTAKQMAKLGWEEIKVQSKKEIDSVDLNANKGAFNITNEVLAVGLAHGLKPMATGGQQDFLTIQQSDGVFVLRHCEDAVSPTKLNEKCFVCFFDNDNLENWAEGVACEFDDVRSAILAMDNSTFLKAMINRDSTRWQIFDW